MPKKICYYSNRNFITFLAEDCDIHPDYVFRLHSRKTGQAKVPKVYLFWVELKSKLSAFHSSPSPISPLYSIQKSEQALCGPSFPFVCHLPFWEHSHNDGLNYFFPLSGLMDRKLSEYKGENCVLFSIMSIHHFYYN